MSVRQYHVIATTEVKRAIVRSRDVREDVAFQNDVNRLLATLNERLMPMRALGWMGNAPGGAAARSPTPSGRDTTPPRILRFVPGTATTDMTPPPASAGVGDPMVQIDWAPAVRRRLG